MRVTMIGAGYVGLVSGACFADFGHHVTCIDKDPARIAALDRGEIPIFEPGLAERGSQCPPGPARLRRQRGRRRRGRRGDDRGRDPVAPRRRPRRSELCVRGGARDRPAVVAHGDLVTKSTVPVGTGDEIERILREKRPDADMQVVSNPEFLREGAAIQDFKHPDRIVVGSDDDRARAVVAELYRPLYLNAAPILYVSRRTAELIKYASNAFLATKITFINEIADL